MFTRPEVITVTVWAARSMRISVHGSALTAEKSPARNSSLTCTGKRPLLSALFLKMSAKKTRYHRTETGTGDGPGGMFAAGAASEITSAHEYPPFETGIVHRKSGVWELPFSSLTPVTEQVFTEALARSGFKKTRRYYLIGYLCFSTCTGTAVEVKSTVNFSAISFSSSGLRPPYFLYPFFICRSCR